MKEQAREECPLGSSLTRRQRPEGAHHVDALHSEEPRQRDQGGEDRRAKQARKDRPVPEVRHLGFPLERLRRPCAQMPENMSRSAAFSRLWGANELLLLLR